MDVNADAAMRLLCQTQTQLMVAENAAMLGRMAATLSHELNTPIGALAGALQTMRSALARIARGEAFEPSRAAELDAQLDGAVRDAMRRVQDVIGQMQRIANLYGATSFAVRIDELIRDVVALLDPKHKLAHAIELELQPELTVECRPEQISSVLSVSLDHLLEIQQRAAKLIIRASAAGEYVVITINAPDLTLAREQVECLLQPGLEASRCTWNLFSARQILLAHGGDLDIASAPESGAVVTLRLPFKARTRV